MAYAIKSEVRDPQAAEFIFDTMKTMYRGRYLCAGDTGFIFASEKQGESGLIAKGVIETAKPVPRAQSSARDTSPVSVLVAHLARAKGQLGRDQVKAFTDWEDGHPATELNFKFYRQSTNKIVGLSNRTAAFLERFF